MNSIVSYPDRGSFGNNRYRGNCSGRLIEDLIDQYRIRQMSDFMVGGGTTEDVCKAHGIPGCFTDLNRGYDMLSMDIPERSESIYWHPPYHNMVVYSGEQYSDKEIISKYGFDPKVNDLSRCVSWEEFVDKMNYCMMKQYAALEKGGRMFVLMGDMKRQGKLYSMLADIVKPDLEQIIIKTQHNCMSDSKTYARQNFVPIVHEYLMVCHKQGGLIIPVSLPRKYTMDVRDSLSASWRDILHSVLEDAGREMKLEELYEALRGHRKTDGNPHWMEKIRQTVQNSKYFTRTARGSYALA